MEPVLDGKEKGKTKMWTKDGGGWRGEDGGGGGGYLGPSRSIPCLMRPK